MGTATRIEHGHPVPMHELQPGAKDRADKAPANLDAGITPSRGGYASFDLHELPSAHHRTSGGHCLATVGRVTADPNFLAYVRRYADKRGVVSWADGQKAYREWVRLARQGVKAAAE